VQRLAEAVKRPSDFRVNRHPRLIAPKRTTPCGKPTQPWCGRDTLNQPRQCVVSDRAPQSTHGRPIGARDVDDAVGLVVILVDAGVGPRNKIDLEVVGAGSGVGLQVPRLLKLELGNVDLLLGARLASVDRERVLGPPAIEQALEDDG